MADTFPALFSHCQRPNVSVASIKTPTSWNLFLHQRLSTTAVSELATLLQALSVIHLDPDCNDRRGVGDVMAPFTSATAYQWHMNRQPSDPFASRIWNNSAIPRCKHFLWLLHRERLPSAALLHRRHIIDVDHCAYCGAPEDQAHILLRCPRARRIWC